MNIFRLVLCGGLIFNSVTTIQPMESAPNNVVEYTKILKHIGLGLGWTLAGILPIYAINPQVPPETPQAIELLNLSKLHPCQHAYEGLYQYNTYRQYFDTQMPGYLEQLETYNISSLNVTCYEKSIPSASASSFSRFLAQLLPVAPGSYLCLKAAYSNLRKAYAAYDGKVCACDDAVVGHDHSN